MKQRVLCTSEVLVSGDPEEVRTLIVYVGDEDESYPKYDEEESMLENVKCLAVLNIDSDGEVFQRMEFDHGEDIEFEEIIFNGKQDKTTIMGRNEVKEWNL